MTILYTPGNPVTRTQLEQQAERYERLAADLRALAAGQPPDLSDAPELDSWRIGARLETCLQGLVNGHPRLSGLKPSNTSALEVIDVEGGWARTWSRWYRLGERALRY